MYLLCDAQQRQPFLSSDILHFLFKTLMLIQPDFEALQAGQSYRQHESLFWVFQLLPQVANAVTAVLQASVVRRRRSIWAPWT